MRCDLDLVDVADSHPRLISALEASHFGRMERNGGFPQGLLDFLYEKMAIVDPDKVLHLCSGSIKRGITVDARPESGAKHICDARYTPFEDSSFDWIVADPPPMEWYNARVYGLPEEEFPQPGELLVEAERLLKLGGQVAILSMLEPRAPQGLVRTGAYALLLGPGFYIRVAFLYRKSETERVCIKHWDRMIYEAPYVELAAKGENGHATEGFIRDKAGHIMVFDSTLKTCRLCAENFHGA